MTRLRVGFLLPRYSAHSTSHFPVVMRALAERGVVVDVIHPSGEPVDISLVRPDHDLYVLKKTSGPALSLGGALYALGAATVNPYPVTVMLRDKIVASGILHSAGLPTPASYVASHATGLAPLLDGGPLIVKPYQGTEGFGIRIARTAAELAAVPAGKDPVFAQRYHPPDGRDLKIYSIGDRLFGVQKVFPARTDRDKYGQPFSPPPELVEIARRCGQAFGIDLYGVDIIESEGQPYVVDVSSIPGFKGVPDAPALLAAYFQVAAQRAARGEPLFQGAAYVMAAPTAGAR